MCAPVYVSGIYNARKAERSPGDGDGDTPNSVVDYFMAAQQIEGIGPVIAVDGQTDDPFVCLHLGGGNLGAKKLGVENGRNTVLAKHGDYLKVYSVRIKARFLGSRQVDGDCLGAEILQGAADLWREHQHQQQPSQHKDDHVARFAQIPPD